MRRSIMPVLVAALICVVFTTDAMAIYHTSLGRFAQRDPIGYPDGMNAYAGHHVVYGGLDPSGLILVAVDGTSSRRYLDGVRAPRRRGGEPVLIRPGAPRTETDLWRSHVRNFYDDYRDPPKRYWHGPDTAFPTTVAARESHGIHNGAYEWVCKQWCDSGCEEPIDLIGHSRGGYIVLQIAESLNVHGCKCDGEADANVPVPVRFLGMYDPVDSAPGFGQTGDIPPNVQNSYVVIATHRVVRGPWTMRRVTVAQSRPFFNREGHEARDPNATNHNTGSFVGTHGGVGGAPWDGDRPHGHTEQNDIFQAIVSDRAMRNSAQAAGVNIPDIGDYGYRPGGGAVD